MATFKDLFSATASDYARFRPHYPATLFAWLAEQAPARGVAVDMGAGNGQAAVALAAHFQRVIAVEPSAAQLASAPADPRIEYRRGAAEATGLADASADLLVVAQAFHWFAQEPFFAEVQRVVRPGGLLAVWCYGLATITPELDALVHELYETFLGPFWEPERRLVEDGYRAVRFPFAELSVPTFQMHLRWSFEHLIGYLSTWSALQRYIRERGDNPLEAMFPRLEQAWAGAPERDVSWPLGVRAFRL
jgi:SAM-dependent methyltransferase